MSVPSSLDAVLQSRVRSLPSNARVILTFLAVQGKPTSLELLAQLTGFPLGVVMAAVREAQDHRLIAFDEDGVKFTHGIVHRWLYEGLSKDEKSTIHKVTAARMLALEAAVNAASLAWHFSEAGEKVKAYEWALKGAEAARSRGAFHEVIELLRIAERNCETGAQRIRILKDLGELLLQHGEMGQALGDLKAAIQI